MTGTIARTQPERENDQQGRTPARAVTVEPPAVVVCASCNASFELSARNAREHRRRGIPHVCHGCRYPPKPPDPKRLASLRAWWLARYSLAELQSWPSL